MKISKIIIHISNIVTYIFTALFYGFLFSYQDSPIIPNSYEIITTSLFSAILICTYSIVAIRNKKRQSFFNFSVLLFFILSILLLKDFIFLRVSSSTISLLFFQNLTYRLMHRSINNGFPIFTYIFNLLILALATSDLAVAYIPAIYKVTNAIEDRFKPQNLNQFNKINKYISSNALFLLYGVIFIFTLIKRFSELI